MIAIGINDKLNNGKAAEAPTYAAIHRCATAQAARNRGVMAFMFSKATELAKRAGKTSLRIDTHPGNAAMRIHSELIDWIDQGGEDIDITVPQN